MHGNFGFSCPITVHMFDIKDSMDALFFLSFSSSVGRVCDELGIHEYDACNLSKHAGCGEI